ncbi:MAG TPA: PAS domain S-box protein, partial [Burkholderiales bacterium]|nr:PAS domain S-box protein [Burkholderiales bacterium]
MGGNKKDRHRTDSHAPAKRDAVAPRSSPESIAARAIAHLAAIVESSQDAIVSRSRDGTILSWNAGAERLYGYAASEVIGRSFNMTIPPDRAHEAAADWERLKRGESVPPYETVRLTKAGGRVSVSISLSPLKDSAGNLEGVAIIARDISPLKRFEDALRCSESRMRAIIELEPECIAIIGADGELLELNRSGLDMLEVETLAEAAQRGMLEFVLPPHRKAYTRLHETVIAGQRGELEYEIMGVKGTRRSVHTCAVPFPEPAGDRPAMLAITRDDTERKRAEQALRDSEAEMRLLADSVPALICYFDADLRCRYANRHFVEFFDYEMHGIVGRHFREIAGEEAYAKVGAHFAEALAGKPTAYERSVATPGRELRYIDVKLYPRVTARGRVHGVYAAAIDITERKSADEARANLAAIVQCSNDAIISRSLEGYITSWNRGAELMFGDTWREAIGRHVALLLPPGEL